MKFEMRGFTKQHDEVNVILLNDAFERLLNKLFQEMSFETLVIKVKA